MIHQGQCDIQVTLKWLCDLMVEWIQSLYTSCICDWFRVYSKSESAFFILDHLEQTISTRSIPKGIKWHSVWQQNAASLGFRSWALGLHVGWVCTPNTDRQKLIYICIVIYVRQNSQGTSEEGAGPACGPVGKRKISRWGYIWRILNV